MVLRSEREDPEVEVDMEAEAEVDEEVYTEAEVETEIETARIQLQTLLDWPPPAQLTRQLYTIC